MHHYPGRRKWACMLNLTHLVRETDFIRIRDENDALLTLVSTIAEIPCLVTERKT
jgi:hypothetical protein